MPSLEIVGYLAGAFVAVSLSPQVIKSWKTKSTKDISLGWTMSYLIGLILWLIYAFGIKSWPLFTMTVVEATMALSLLLLKLKHG